MRTTVGSPRAVDLDHQGPGHQRISWLLSVALVLCACGGNSPGNEPGADSGTDARTDGRGPNTTPSLSDQELETAQGCSGVFNPDQVLDYYLEMAPGDFSALLADQTNSVYFPAELRCGDEEPFSVGVRRKRSGGNVKVGLKVDIDYVFPNQTFYGLKKLSLENGVSEGTTTDNGEASSYLSEYLGWRLMVLSGLVTSRAVFARVHVNGELLGVYVNVEQVDKRFLLHRLRDNSGWLYKKSGSTGDGLKTHETDGLADPYADYFCFWESGGGACAVPPADALAQELPAHLDMEQMLTLGAVNALIANTDAIIFKDNNYYFYDWSGGRLYLPWDLDTAMKEHFDVFAGGGGGMTDKFTAVLFSHWEDDYDAILTDLLANALSLDAIDAEIARAETVAAGAFASDPYMNGTMDSATSEMRIFWAERHAEVQAQVDAH